MKKYILLTAIFISCVNQNLFAQHSTNEKNINSMVSTTEKKKLSTESQMRKKFSSVNSHYCDSTGNTTRPCKSTDDCDHSIDAFCNVTTEPPICNNFPLGVCLYSY